MSKKAIDTFFDALQDYPIGRLDYQFSSRHAGERHHANVRHPDAVRVDFLLTGLGDPEDIPTSWDDVFHSNEEEQQDSLATSSLVLLPFPLILNISVRIIDLPG